MDKDTGGQAFPGKICTGNQPMPDQPMYEHPKGMTLRDYFAGQALIGILANSELAKVIVKEGTKDGIERVSYEFADAMIKERNK